MRVLITGAGGQLGRALVTAFDGHDVTAARREQLDVGDRDAVLQALTGLRPHAVVHAGAWTDVDGCESNPDRAFRVNALGTRHVAEGARLVGASVCYLSTDYVFDGTATVPYVEWDGPSPQSVYGRSKLGGEQELAGDPHATIVRTSWLWARDGRNFVTTILRLATERQGAAQDGAQQPLTVVDDQHGCPTYTADLAAMIRRLVVARWPGTFHVTNQGATTWYGFARALVTAAGLDPELVTPIPTSELRPARPAPRPAFSVLDNAALRLSGVALLPHWQDSLERVVKALAAV